MTQARAHLGAIHYHRLGLQAMGKATLFSPFLCWWIATLGFFKPMVQATYFCSLRHLTIDTWPWDWVTNIVGPQDTFGRPRRKSVNISNDGSKWKPSLGERQRFSDGDWDWWCQICSCTHHNPYIMMIIYLYLFIFIYIYSSICIFIYSVFISIYLYIYIHIYTYIYIYICVCVMASRGNCPKIAIFQISELFTIITQIDLLSTPRCIFFYLYHGGCKSIGRQRAGHQYFNSWLPLGKPRSQKS